MRDVPRASPIFAMYNDNRNMIAATPNRRLLRTTALPLLIAAFSCLPAPAQSKINLRGAWRAAALTRTGPDAATNNNPQPGMFLFTEKHYSLAVVRSDKPRPELPADSSKATAAELLAAYDPFGANSGTYELSGETLTFHPIVAQNPSGMRPGHVIRYTIKQDGEALSLTEVNVRRYPFTYKLVRLE